MAPLWLQLPVWRNLHVAAFRTRGTPTTTYQLGTTTVP